jgi:prepilin-type N-terminal cleavage/methylation domain-containing protein
MKKQNGFTIYELLTVIGIIAVLAIIATPNMISWRSEIKLRGASNNLRADLHYRQLLILRITVRGLTGEAFLMLQH